MTQLLSFPNVPNGTIIFKFPQFLKKSFTRLLTYYMFYKRRSTELVVLVIAKRLWI